MVIIPGELVFLANPRTASRTVGNLLESKSGVRGLQRPGRHVPREDVPLELNLPIWSFTRHPYRHALSWWYFLRQKQHVDAFNEERSRLLDFEDWLDKPFDALPGHDFPRQRLNMYEGVATHWWTLEDGVENWLRKVGFGHVADRMEPRDTVGVSGVDTSLLTATTRAKIRRNFRADWDLWHTVVGDMPQFF